jgi:hypothetical protein
MKLKIKKGELVFDKKYISNCRLVFVIDNDMDFIPYNYTNLSLEEIDLIREIVSDKNKALLNIKNEKFGDLCNFLLKNVENINIDITTSNIYHCTDSVSDWLESFQRKGNNTIYDNAGNNIIYDNATTKNIRYYGDV